MGNIVSWKIKKNTDASKRIFTKVLKKIVKSPAVVTMCVIVAIISFYYIMLTYPLELLGAVFIIMALGILGFMYWMVKELIDD